MDEADKLAFFNRLKQEGMSDHEARVTVFGNEWDTDAEKAESEAWLAGSRECHGGAC